MSKILGIITGLLIILAAGCAPREHFLKLAAKTQPKAVMVEVDTSAKRMTLSIEDGFFVITVATAPVTYMGAGVFISDNGHILTCAHLFESDYPIRAVRVMEVDGSTVPAKLLYADSKKDLALLKISSPFVYGYATLTREQVQIGQEVLAVGNPHGLPFSVSHGIISAFRLDFDNGYAFTQDDVAINHGNSGGPLFNLRGELIGINTLKDDSGEGLSFAVAPETIREFLRLFRGL